MAMIEENPEEIISKGDWVTVESSAIDVGKGRVKEIVPEKGCRIESTNNRIVAVFWNEIVSVRTYCNSCRSRKVYHDKQEVWLCPHCEI